MKERIEELKALFDLMPGWADRYNYLIELGENLPPMSLAFKVPENRIICNSMLYFYVYFSEEICYIEAEANAAVPQGLAALLSSICNGISRPELFAHLPLLEAFIHESGLLENLTLTRREALLSMLGKIRNNR